VGLSHPNLWDVLDYRASKAGDLILDTTEETEQCVVNLRYLSLLKLKCRQSLDSSNMTPMTLRVTVL